MRQIFIAWIFTLSQVALATTAYDVRDGKQLSSQAFYENYIKNGTFEQNNENAITDASAIAAISATTPISGTYSLGIDATTSGQLVKMQGRTISQVGASAKLYSTTLETRAFTKHTYFKALRKCLAK